MTFKSSSLCSSRSCLWSDPQVFLTCTVVQRRVGDAAVGDQSRLEHRGLRDELEGDVPVAHSWEPMFEHRLPFVEIWKHEEKKDVRQEKLCSHHADHSGGSHLFAASFHFSRI